mgnify:CR=1 FL=1
MKKLFKKSLLFGLAGLLGILTFNTPVNAATTSYSYTGAEQTYTIPTTGEYTVTLTGAQGGNTGSYTGGKGSLVKRILKLNAGDVLTIAVGGQGKTFNGGGSGKATNGGGATTLKVNGTLVAVAAGGGGATAHGNGLPGGDAAANNNGTYLNGSTSTEANSAGGGGGYRGGTAGNVIYHAHSTSTCTYTTSTGIIWIPVEYYVHNNGKGDYYFYGQCPNCGTVYAGDASNGLSDYSSPYPHPCPHATPTINYTCGKTPGVTVDSANPSYGGTCFTDNDANALTSHNYQSGNGSFVIEGAPTITFDYNLPNTSMNITGNTVTSKSAEVLSSGSSSNEFTYGSLPTPTSTDFTFLGWSKTKNIPFADIENDNYEQYLIDPSLSSDTSAVGNAALKEKYIITANTTLYAVWDVSYYNLSFSDSTSYSNFDSMQVAYGQPYGTLPAPISNKADFAGWYTAASGGTKVTDSTVHNVLSDTTLYARWTAKSYTVTFNANGGTLNGSSSKAVTFGSKVGTLPTASKSGVQFDGWYLSTEADAEQLTAESDYTWENNLTVYAKYRVNSVNFGYTGAVQNWTVPESGYYKIEAWGAQGVSYGGYAGGKGGYIHGVKYLTAGQVVQVYVGGQGTRFNGGGQGTFNSAGYHGGDATDLRISGTRFMIAAGGGAGSPAGAGGAGGAINTSTAVSYANGASGGFGGGAGYTGGAAGKVVYHSHTSSCQHHHSDGCYRRGDCGAPLTSLTGATQMSSSYSYWEWRCAKGHSQWRSSNSMVGPCYAQGEKYLACSRGGRIECGKTAGVTIDSYTLSSGGTSWADSSVMYKTYTAGNRSGHGYARITPLYEIIFDLNKPTTNNADVNATNVPTIVAKAEIAKNSNYWAYNDILTKTTALSYTEGNTSTFSFLVESGQAYNYIERRSALPLPLLKGWKFVGWYTEPNYKTTTGSSTKAHSGSKVNPTTTFNFTSGMNLLGNRLYAHWDEEVYYIKYYMNNTTKNVYSDTYTNPTAHFDTTLTGAVKGNGSGYVYNASEDSYTQTVKYDHSVTVLPNYYAKTGYYFKNWTNASDTTLKGTKGTGTGTGKQTGTTYQESTTLTSVKNGETFQAGKANFNYITNEKALGLGTTSTASWHYGSDTVVFYAVWEPIKYTLRFNGTDNWNNSSSFTTGTHTGEDSYLQKVTNAAGSQDTKIRYDQVFTLNPNLFERKAPHMVTSPQGNEVQLNTGYGHLGWGFGQNTMKYSSSPSYKLISMNTKADNEQALTSDSDTKGKDYSEAQANVKNVISSAGIQKITKYISDWSNARTNSNRKDKSDIENNVIESNLHSLWRRNSNDDHENNGDEEGGKCGNGKCSCPVDANGNCTCPSSNCPDLDNDGTCDCHDPDPTDPTVPDNKCPDGCMCPDNGLGGCDCPSSLCPDNDSDGTCDCHDPAPSDPNIPNNGDKCPCDKDGDGDCPCPSDNCPDKDNDGVCDNHDPDPNDPFVPNDGGDDTDTDKDGDSDCPCGDSDGDGDCDCPSDDCPDNDKDGICDNHDTDPNNPDIPINNGDDTGDCPCGDTDGDGDCDCPSDNCPDGDGDGVCDNHDPAPNNPHIPSKCPCGTDENGDCHCPSDNCPDRDGDGVCDYHDPDPDNPNIPSKCPCGTGPDGECICPDENCPDKDNDGVCDNHDPDPNDPNNPNPGCTCPKDENGNCTCPSDDCPDRDGDGVCDNHDPDPDDPNIPNPNGGNDDDSGDTGNGDDNDGGDADNPNDKDNFGITLTFDLNGGYIVGAGNQFIYGPVVLRQELFNDYFYEFDIIGNTNKDHLNNEAVVDAYGAKSNTSTPKKNYDNANGVNYTFRKTDGEGGLYRLSGWSTDKGAIYPEYAVTIDGMKNNNFDAFDFVKNNKTLTICNDTTLYAVWEPVLQMNVTLMSLQSSAKAKTGTLTQATQESMQSKGLPTLEVKPGQEVKYYISLKGETVASALTNGASKLKNEPLSIQIEFDPLMTGIYTTGNKELHDNLNEISADDLDDPNEKILLNTSNLNRRFTNQSDKSISRKFGIPLYLGTDRAAELGYPSYKEGGYSLTVTAKRFSNFYKDYETVTAKLLLDTNGRGSGSGSGGNGGGSGGSNLPSSTLGEFRTNIRIK